MPNATQELRCDRQLRAAVLIYFAASLLHFSHNARYLSSYPNLPAWISAGSVYFTWLGLTAVGCLGYLLYRRHKTLPGLALLGVYAGGGLAGLLHYTRAPYTAHSVGMNFTILFESAAAAALLAVSARAGIHRRKIARSSAARCVGPTIDA